MTDDWKVDFDFTLDEAAEFQLEHLKGTREGRSWRRREQWMFALGLTAVLGAFLAFQLRDRPALLVVMIGAVLVTALALMIPFGWHYDHLVRTRMRKLLAEQLGPGPYHCAIEIRPEGLWVAQAGLELKFPWDGALRASDTAAGILAEFRNHGRVLARSRGFRSAEHKAKFFEKLREVVPEVALDPPRSS